MEGLPTDDEIMKEIEAEAEKGGTPESFVKSLKDPMVGLGQLPTNIMSNIGGNPINTITPQYDILNNQLNPLHPLNHPLHPLNTPFNPLTMPIQTMSLPPPLSLPKLDDSSQSTDISSPIPLPSPFDSSGKELFPDKPVQALDHGIQQLTLLLQTAQRHAETLKESAKHSLETINSEKGKLKSSVSSYKANKKKIAKIQKSLDVSYRNKAIALLNEQAENAKSILSSLKKSAKESEGFESDDVLNKVSGIQEQINSLQSLFKNATSPTDVEGIEDLDLDTDVVDGQEVEEEETEVEAEAEDDTESEGTDEETAGNSSETESGTETEPEINPMDEPETTPSESTPAQTSSTTETPAETNPSQTTPASI